MYRIICRKHGNAMGLVLAQVFSSQEDAERKVTFWKNLFPYTYTVVHESEVILPV